MDFWGSDDSFGPITEETTRLLKADTMRKGFPGIKIPRLVINRRTTFGPRFVLALAEWFKNETKPRDETTRSRERERYKAQPRERNDQRNGGGAASGR